MTVLMPNDPFVLLENSRDPRAASLLFEQPERIVRCDDPAGIEAALADIQQGLDEGLHAAGWLSYEIGYALEPRLAPLMPRERREPLIWFGLFSRRRRLERADVDIFWRERTQGSLVTRLRLEQFPGNPGDTRPGCVRLEPSASAVGRLVWAVESQPPDRTRDVVRTPQD